jgi:glutamate racemase
VGLMAKIIVFDSGFGSLSIIQPLQKAIKSNIVYFADQKNFPYGKKSKSQLTKIITKTLKFLNEKFQPDLIIIGSNTPSLLVEINKKNVIKILPPIKNAAKISVTGNVAVLATSATIQSKKLTDYLRRNRLPKHVNVKKIDASALIDLVEHAKFISDHKLCDRTIENVLSEPFCKFNVDVATLSSTHLPFLLPLLKKQFPSVIFLDPAQEVVEKVRRIMRKKQSKSNTLKIFTSSDPKRFESNLLRMGIKKSVRLLV